MPAQLNHFDRAGDRDIAQALGAAAMNAGADHAAVGATLWEVRGDRDNTDAGGVVIDGGKHLVIGQIEDCRGRIRARLARLDLGSWFLTDDECLDTSIPAGSRVPTLLGHEPRVHHQP